MSTYCKQFLALKNCGFSFFFLCGGLVFLERLYFTERYNLVGRLGGRDGNPNHHRSDPHKWDLESIALSLKKEGQESLACAR